MRARAVLLPRVEGAGEATETSRDLPTRGNCRFAMNQVGWAKNRDSESISFRASDRKNQATSDSARVWRGRPLPQSLRPSIKAQRPASAWTLLPPLLNPHTHPTHQPPACKDGLRPAVQPLQPAGGLRHRQEGCPQEGAPPPRCKTCLSRMSRAAIAPMAPCWRCLRAQRAPSALEPTISVERCERNLLTDALGSACPPLRPAPQAAKAAPSGTSFYGPDRVKFLGEWRAGRCWPGSPCWEGGGGR